MDKLIIFTAEYLVWVITIIALAFVVLTRAYKRKELYTLSGSISVIALMLDKILNKLIASPRPFVLEGITPVVSHVSNNGFPSEHTLFAIVISGIIFLYNKKIGVILGILSIAVGIGRVLAKVHNPVDIVGSVVIGTTSVYIGVLLVKRYFSRFIKKMI